ncbi:MAG: TonB-dependent receptor [bacterium]
MLKKFLPSALLLFCYSVLYAEEGTTTIPQSELIITGSDKSFLEWKEEPADVELSFPLMDAPKPKVIEKEKENIELNIEKKEGFKIKETSPQFLKEEALPWIKISIGNYNFFSSSILFAKEKGKFAGSLEVERERRGGFKWQNKNDFHSQSKDNINLFLGMAFNEARIVIPFSFFNEEVFLPFENRQEKRKRAGLELGYETPFYNNLVFSGNIWDEKKDFIKNRGIGTKLSFDFAKKSRLNIIAENEGDLVERRFLKIFFSFYPTKKEFKKRGVLILSDAGFSIFKNKKAMFQPELDISLKSKIKDMIFNLSLKNFLNSPSFSKLYFQTPYSTISTSLEPERVFMLSGGISLKRKSLYVKNSLFLENKNNAIEWYKKADGLLSLRNSGSLFSYGIKTNVNYSLTKKIDTEFSGFIMGLSKDINYMPQFEGDFILRYKDKGLLISPYISFKGSQKTDSGEISPYFVFNIKGKKKISDEFEIFLDIENLFNSEYKEMEDYPGKKFLASCGVKIKL